MLQSDDYCVLTSLSEIEAFLARLPAFNEALAMRAEIEMGVPLDRIGSYDDLVARAGKTSAIQEILTENAGDLPHLMLFPSGELAVLRYLGSCDYGDEAQIRIAICPAETSDAGTMREALAQTLLGLQDSVRAETADLPLASRADMDWPELLLQLFDRASLETAYDELVAARETRKAAADPHPRSNLLDEFVSWYERARKAYLAERARDENRAGAQGRQSRGSSNRSGRAPVDLKKHVINMRYGELSNSGQHQTTPSDVQGLVESAKDWIAQKPGRRLGIYAHGGLVSEGEALAYAQSVANWWLDNGVYPVFCIWESDTGTTLLQLIREVVGKRGRGRDWWSDNRDKITEKLVHTLGGQPIWAVMKRNAMNCSADGLQHGLTLLARRIKQTFGRSVPPIDLVGHSAGAIVLLPFLARLKAEGLAAETFQTLAPAATTKLYRDYLAHYDSASLKTRIYAMQDEAEREDSLAGFYGKSLLYLVSRGFEDEFDEEISALQKDLLADRKLIALLCRWSDGVTREAMVFSPTPPGTPDRLRSCATKHGAFDNDNATMLSVMALIRSQGDVSALHNLPEEVTRQRSGRGSDLQMPLPEEVRSYLDMAWETSVPTYATAPVPTIAPAPAGVLPAEARRGAKLALTIGIDEYASANRLSGCVNDSNSWREILQRRGFQVTQLARPDETGRDQIIARLREFVASGGPDDTLVWHFSGHGIEIEPEYSSDDDVEQRGLDQAIVASNGSPGLPSQIAHALIDDDIHAILSQLNPQTACYVFLDSCFSGSATRFALPGRPRSMGTLRQSNYRPRNRSLTAPASASRSGAYNGANHVLFSAASATQTALEDGTPAMGLFSRAVGRLLGAPSLPMSNAEFCLRVNEMIPGNDQTPGVYCDPALRDQPFPLAGG